MAKRHSIRKLPGGFVSVFLVLFLFTTFSSPPVFSASDTCVSKCPVFPDSNNCFVDTDGLCKKKVMRMVTEEEPCGLWWGMCRWGCFEDVDGKCKKKVTKKVTLSEGCEMVCQ